MHKPAAIHAKNSLHGSLIDAKTQQFVNWGVAPKYQFNVSLLVSFSWHIPTICKSLRAFVSADLRRIAIRLILLRSPSFFCRKWCDRFLSRGVHCTRMWVIRESLMGYTDGVRTIQRSPWCVHAWWVFECVSSGIAAWRNDKHVTSVWACFGIKLSEVRHQIRLIEQIDSPDIYIRVGRVCHREVENVWFNVRLNICGHWTSLDGCWHGSLWHNTLLQFPRLYKCSYRHSSSNLYLTQAMNSFALFYCVGWRSSRAQ